MKKIICTLCLMALLIPTVAGCTQATATNSTKPDEKVPTETVDTYPLTGEIIEFEGDYIHILSGDIVERVKCSKENQERLYIGELVQVVEKGNKTTIEPYLQKDFSIKHTNMGHLITSVTGTLKNDVSGKEIIVTVGDKEHKFETYEDHQLPAGTSVTVEYIDDMNQEGNLTFIALYNNDSTLQLTVEKIERSPSGEMMIHGVDHNNMKSIVTVKTNTDIQFNLSELKEGSLVMVYPSSIKESAPQQVDAQRILIGVIN